MAMNRFEFLKVRSFRALLLLCSVATALLVACAGAPQMRGQIAGLQELTIQAERNGAMRCAPRELALAKAHLRFAEIELSQGYMSKARHHLSVAEPNAEAANELSPPEYCAARRIVEPGDRDGDGYLDNDDKCPDDPENFNGTDDLDGCPDDPDTDADGITDSLDSCVLEPEDKDSYLDEDGCPELDNDLDTLLDPTDKCPNDPEDPDGFEDTDGCPDPDNDADTVLDVRDECPNIPGQTSGEPLGCPPPLVVVTDCEVKITQQIHFEYNKSVIRPESFPVLNAVVDVMQKNPSIKLEVQGHTDNVGTASYNKRLSDSRSASVKTYLTSHGVKGDRLTSKGYGFDRPLVPNDTAQNRALNRRVQFIRTEGSKEGCPK